MRYLVIILILMAGNAHAQEEIYPDVFQNLKGTKAIRTFSGDTLKYSYTVSPEGLVLGKRMYFKENAVGKEIYSYEGGKITSSKAFHEREYSYENEGTTTSYSPSDIKWDSTRVTREIKYTQGPNGVTAYKYFANPGNELLTDIAYAYNTEGKLKRADITTHPRSTEQNSVTRAAKALSARRKEYAYEPNLTTIYYYVSNKLTGTENIVTTTDGKPTIKVTKDAKGRILGRTSYTYNTQGQLTEQQINDVGEDAFGRGRVIPFDSETYIYDQKGRMVAKLTYSRGKVIGELTYRYDD